MTYPGPRQPPAGQFGYPLQQPPKKKLGAGKIVLLVIGVIVALCAVGGIIAAVAGGKTANNASDKPPAATKTTGAAKKPAGKPKAAAHTNPRQGQPARDGKFEFTVTGVTYGKTQVGNQYAGKQAQGQFVLVQVTVKNIGTQAQTFDASSQKAAGNGNTYSADSEAGIYANTGDQTFLNEINPGNQAQGTLVFDIPKTARLASIELHDSPFSGGVTVDLT